MYWPKRRAGKQSTTKQERNDTSQQERGIVLSRHTHNACSYSATKTPMRNLCLPASSPKTITSSGLTKVLTNQDDRGPKTYQSQQKNINSPAYPGWIHLSPVPSTQTTQHSHKQRLTHKAVDKRSTGNTVYSESQEETNADERGYI